MLRCQTACFKLAAGVGNRWLYSRRHQFGSRGPILLQQVDEGGTCGEPTGRQRAQATILVLLVVVKHDADEATLAEDCRP
ncbi:hypothetical protein SALBM135S_07009 [Streptomyces alboniger]